MTRQWRLLRVLHGSRYMTMRTLAERFEVNVKTIRRDVQCLEAAGFPIYTEPSGDGNLDFIRLERDWFLRGEPKAGKGVRELERRVPIIA
jgi:predicted DNA-binding transcriptional regulator YafY